MNLGIIQIKDMAEATWSRYFLWKLYPFHRWLFNAGLVGGALLVVLMLIITAMGDSTTYVGSSGSVFMGASSGKQALSMLTFVAFITTVAFLMLYAARWSNAKMDFVLWSMQNWIDNQTTPSADTLKSYMAGRKQEWLDEKEEAMKLQ